MKRKIFVCLKVMGLLLTALCVNYAMAWLCAIRSPAEYYADCSIDLCADCTEIKQNTGFPNQAELEAWVGVGYMRRYMFLVPENGYATGYMISKRKGEQCYELFAAGWPALSFESRVIARDEGGHYIGKRKWALPWHVILWRGYNTSDLPQWIGAKENRRLPIVPMWPGFAINILFYLVLAFLMFNSHWLVNALIDCFSVRENKKSLSATTSTS